MAGKESSQNISKTQDRVIKLISKPSSQRTNMEIDFVLPWLKKKSDVLMKISNAILKDIVRNCDFLRTDKEDIIIRQGETGDCLYILLRGSVSVFIKETPTGDDFTNDSHPLATATDSGAHRNWQQIAQEICEEIAVKKTKKPDRASFGKKIVSIGAGRAFGEIALLSAESIRTASILSEESCDLMVVNRNLYNSTLKSYDERDFEERRQFIEHNPLFRNWNPRMKKQLERSLIKEYHSTDTCVIRQGDKLKGLIFIREGHAKVMIEPGKHDVQYPHMRPFPKESNLYDVECLRGKKMKRRSSSDSTRDQSNYGSSMRSGNQGDGNQAHQVPVRKPLSFVQIRVKRKEGYAAAERRITHRSVILCTVRDGAMFGDIEMSQSLKTYSQSVVTLVPTETYCISTRNVERLIQKRSPTTMKKLLDIVLWKMCNRATSVQGNLVPLIQHLVFKMQKDASSETASRLLPPIQGGKQLPQGESMIQNLVQEYLKDKAQLIVPYVPGGVYYKTVMRKRAAERATVRRRREKIRLEIMEKEMRHQMAKTINYQKVLETGWNLAPATDEDSSSGTSEDDNKDEKPHKTETMKKVQKRITPRILSQSDPVISRPNSSRGDDGSRAFMTELDEIVHAGEASGSIGVKGSISHQEKVDVLKESFRKNKNHTVCMVYDEVSGSSMIKHYGPSSSNPADAMCLYGGSTRIEEESDSSNDDVFMPHAISDSHMVGAHKFLTDAEKSAKIDNTKSFDGDNTMLFLPSIKVRTVHDSDSKEGTDDEASQPTESARHSFSAPQNSRLRANTAYSRNSRRKSASLVPLPRVTSSESHNKPSATMMKHFDDVNRNGSVVNTGENYMDMMKQSPAMINPV